MPTATITRFLRPVIVSSVVGVLLLGCGDSSDSSTTPEATATPAASQTTAAAGSASTTSPAGGSGGGGASATPGSVTIGGASSKIDRVVRCKPAADKDLDLVVFAGKSQIFINKFAGTATIHSIDYQGPEGLFSGSYSEQQGAWIGADLSDRVTAAPIVVDGNRVSAAMKLTDLDIDKTLDVALSLILPTSTTDCS